MPPDSASKSTAALPASVLAAEQRAREFIACQQWRKARDELKPLVKADRPRFLPLLIEANLGLARAMMAKGQVAEAQQVLTYLAGIAPADQLRGIELELLQQSGTGGSSSSSLLRLATALCDTAHPLPEPERVRLADSLVLGFTPLPGDDPAYASLAAELKAVLDALLALSQARWEAMNELLRPVPRRSVLGHWVGFLKGLAAFYAQDGDKAERFFRDLPAGSVPARASQPVLFLAGKLPSLPAGKLPSEPLLEGACLLGGQPGLAAPLLRAETAWRARAFTKSYRALRDAVPAFPTAALNPLGLLSRFYFQIPLKMQEPELQAYMPFLDGLIQDDRFKNGAETMFTFRLFSLLDAAVAPPAVLREDWEEFLRHLEIIHGKQPRRASLALLWLGEQLAARRGPTPFLGQRRVLRDAKGAVAALKRSIELDPENLPAHLRLCEVYAALAQRSERNRLLDGMTARFPEEKAVLLLAARGCLERKALNKGLHYLDRARELDPLDPAIPELTLQTHRQLAQQHFQQGRAAKARQVLAQSEALLVDEPDDLVRSRWTALARHGVMESIWGDAGLGADLLAQSRTQAPHPASCCLFVHLAQRYCTNRHSTDGPFFREARQVIPATADFAVVRRLASIMDYWMDLLPELSLLEEERLIGKAFKAAMKRPYTRAEALAAIEAVGRSPECRHLAGDLVKKMQRDDPTDPQLGLVDYELSSDWSPFETRRPTLEGILAEALRRRDDATVTRVRALLRELSETHPLPLPGRGVDPWDEDDEDDEDDFTPFTGGLPEISPAEQEGLAEFLERIRIASPAELAELRRLRPRDMPKEVLDVLINAARSGPSAPLPPFPLPPRLPKTPLPPRPPKPPRQPEPRQPDPHQPDLF